MLFFEYFCILEMSGLTNHSNHLIVLFMNYLGFLSAIGIALLGICLYFLPTLTASGKEKIRKIFHLNILVGWTFLGWVYLIYYAYKDKKQKVILVTGVNRRYVFYWIFAVFFTIVAAEYQKMTGPTYPVKGKVTLNNQKIKCELIRTAENDEDAEISLIIPDQLVSGTIEYKRYKSNDSLSTSPLVRSGDKLVFMMPKLEAAGKMMYEITLQSGSETVKLSGRNGQPVVMRFKGHVPYFILIPHILLMFLGLLFSSRTAIEALIRGADTYKYSLFTLLFLIPGGLILGPIVQKYAFGAYWTGWPFGHDLTDNKTIVMVLVWVLAALKLRKDPLNRTWPVVAAIVVLVVYLIPHSAFGSEIDYTKVGK
jgi:hypothetical protein